MESLYNAILFSKNEILIHNTWVKPKSIMLSEKSQSREATYSMPTYETFRIGKSAETESRWAAQALGVSGWDGTWLLMDTEFLLGAIKIL